MSEFEQHRQWNVDFEHDNDYTKVSFSVVYAKSAKSAEALASRFLIEPEQWRCVAIDLVRDA